MFLLVDNQFTEYPKAILYDIPALYPPTVIKPLEIINSIFFLLPTI